VTDLFSVKESPFSTIEAVRRAVVHVNIDPAGALSHEQVARALEALRGDFDPIATDLERHPPTKRLIELLREGDDVEELRRSAEAACAAAVAEFAPPLAPRVEAVSFISTGTREDALGIVRSFGLDREVEELRFDGDDVAVLVLDPAALRRMNAGKLQTALECALNREVHLRDSAG